MDFHGPPPLVALGLLSTVGSFGTGRDRAGIGGVIGGSTWRRARLRASARQSTAWTTGQVVLRFVLAGNPVKPPYMRPGKASELTAAYSEAATHGDMLFLNTSEDTFRCSAKYLLWFRHVASTWPAARFMATGDDDIYIQFEHLEAEMRLVHAQTAGEPALWGLLTWAAYYNNATFSPSVEFMGWGVTDVRAWRFRERVEACATFGTACAAAKIREGPLFDVRSGQVDPIGPWPFANGPLMAVSHELGRLIAADELPWAWLDALGRTKLVRRAVRERRRPFHVARKGCWPAGDAVFGLWITRLAALRRFNVSLINSPFMKQHHTWPTSTHGAFSNSSIVMHDLKDNRTDFFWRFAERRGSGPFAPTARTCDTCAAMGWATSPGSAHAKWRCCGDREATREAEGRSTPARRQARGDRRRIRRTRRRAGDIIIQTVGNGNRWQWQPVTFASSTNFTEYQRLPLPTV